MNVENKYLSDNKLENLIADIEAGDMVFAPPELKENILAKIVEENNSEKAAIFSRQNKYCTKLIDFRHYCIKVIAASAAAIFLICATPLFFTYENADIPSKADMGYSLKTKAEVLAEERESINELSLIDRLMEVEIFHK